MKSEKQILENLKQQGEAFEMKVSDDLWGAIESEIAADAGKKRGAILAWISIVTGGAALIAVYILLLITPISDSKNSFSQAVRLLNETSFNSQAKIFSTAAQEKPTEEKSLSNITGAIKSSNNNSLNQRNNLPALTNGNAQSVTHSNPSLMGVENIVDEVDPDVNKGQNVISTDSELIGIQEKPLENDLAENTLTLDSVLLANDNDLLVKKETDSITTNGNELTGAPIQKSLKANRFALLLTGGLGSSYRTLNSDVFHSLVSHKDDHESYGRAFKFGMQLEWRITEGVFLRTGILYSRYSEHYEFHHDVISHATDNDYNYFQVPLIAGFRLANFKRSDLNILPGMTWNFLHSAQSSWVDPSALTLVLHSDADEITPFRGATIGLSLAFEYRWRISEKFNLHVSPGLDGFTQSVYKRNTELVQRPFSFNGALGLSYSF